MLKALYEFGSNITNKELRDAVYKYYGEDYQTGLELVESVIIFLEYLVMMRGTESSWNYYDANDDGAIDATEALDAGFLKDFDDYKGDDEKWDIDEY